MYEFHHRLRKGGGLIFVSSPHPIRDQEREQTSAVYTYRFEPVWTRSITTAFIEICSCMSCWKVILQRKIEISQLESGTHRNCTYTFTSFFVSRIYFEHLCLQPSGIRWLHITYIIYSCSFFSLSFFAQAWKFRANFLISFSIPEQLYRKYIMYTTITIM